MNQSRTLSDLSVTELKKVLQIKEELAGLETQLEKVLGATHIEAPRITSSAKPGRGKRGGRRKLSEEARERIASAQRARWAKRSKNGTHSEPASATKTTAGKRGGRRKLSAEARERIASAQRARWASRRGGETAVKAEATPKAVAGKRGGRRQLSPEARERIAAAQRARWAASRKGK